MMTMVVVVWEEEDVRYSPRVILPGSVVTSSHTSSDPYCAASLLFGPSTTSFDTWDSGNNTTMISDTMNENLLLEQTDWRFWKLIGSPEMITC